MKVKVDLVNLGMTLASVFCGLLLCEFGSRLVLNPADYLGVGMVKDDIMGAVPPAAPRTGFDNWGFRNPGVPQKVDMVAIGDSHTYGNTAKMGESWPKVLGRLSSSSVYNMGMGGYGPNQYYYLLKTKALTLKPRTVLCGLYVGDDFENAFTITYGLDYWAYLRKLPAGKVRSDIWEVATSPTWQKASRIWLSEHSIIYQLVFHASFLGRLQGQAQIKSASSVNDAAVSLIVPEKHIMEVFLPKGILSRLDQESQNVREGMRITFRLIGEMSEMCRANQVQFLVVVIPTKEMVFADYIENNPGLHLNEVMDKLLRNERLALQRTFEALDDLGVSYVDTLPPLKSAVQDELYVRSATDMHPGRNGYRVIAQTVFEALKQKE